MLAKRIIPCLDCTAGRVVKGTKFLHLKDAGDPVEVAKRYNEEGADEIVFLDITASHEGRQTMLDVVEKTATQVFMPLTVGGGVRKLDDIKQLLRAGADKVSLNTAAVSNPKLVAEGAAVFGGQCIVVAIDAKRVVPENPLDTHPSWTVFTHGGRKQTPLDVVSWAKEVEGLGAGEILLTSMDKDGTQDGYDMELLQAVCNAVNIPVIASGGAGTLEHFYLALAQTQASAVLAASLFHFGQLTISQTKEYLKTKGIPIRT